MAEFMMKERYIIHRRRLLSGFSSSLLPISGRCCVISVSGYYGYQDQTALQRLATIP